MHIERHTTLDEGQPCSTYAIVAGELEMQSILQCLMLGTRDVLIGAMEEPSESLRYGAQAGVDSANEAMSEFETLRLPTM